MPKAYDHEFKAGVLEVARKREVPLQQVAKDFNISITCLEKWLRADRAAGDNVSAAKSVSLMEENKLLKQRNKLLEQEVEVFRRAHAYLAKDMLDYPKGFTR